MAIILTLGLALNVREKKKAPTDKSLRLKLSKEKNEIKRIILIKDVGTRKIC